VACRSVRSDSLYEADHRPPSQTLAAFSLALLTNSTRYYTEALNHYRTLPSAAGSVLNWDSREPAIYVLLVDIALARPGMAVQAGLATNLTGWQTQAEGYFDAILAGESKRPYFTKGM
jgi:endoglucanase